MKWRDIEQGLGEQRVPAEGDSDAFWEQFKGRTRTLVQDEPEQDAGYGVLRWASVPTFCLVIAVVGWLSLNLNSTSSAEAVAQLPEVNALTVDVEHSAVFIMNDEQSQGTVVWIADMKLPESPNRSAASAAPVRSKPAQ